MWFTKTKNAIKKNSKPFDVPHTMYNTSPITRNTCSTGSPIPRAVCQWKIHKLRVTKIELHLYIEAIESERFASVLRGRMDEYISSINKCKRVIEYHGKCLLVDVNANGGSIKY